MLRSVLLMGIPGKGKPGRLQEEATLTFRFFLLLSPRMVNEALFALPVSLFTPAQ